MEQKFDHTTYVFERLFSPTFKLNLGIFKNFTFVQAKTESGEWRQGSVIIKIFIIRFFDMMEQRVDTPNLGFWALDFTYIQIKLIIFTNLAECKRKQKVLKA